MVFGWIAMRLRFAPLISCLVAGIGMGPSTSVFVAERGFWERLRTGYRGPCGSVVSLRCTFFRQAANRWC
jgi:hypothetical protein